MKRKKIKREQALILPVPFCDRLYLVLFKNEGYENIFCFEIQDTGLNIRFLYLSSAV